MKNEAKPEPSDDVFGVDKFAERHRVFVASIKRVPSPEYKAAQTALNVDTDNRVVVTSEGLGWANIHASITSEVPHHAIHPPTPDLWLVFNLQSADLFWNAGDDAPQHASLSRLHLSIVAPDTPFTVQLNTETKVLHVFVKREVLRDVWSKMFDSDFSRMEIVTRLGIEDSRLSTLLRPIEQMLANPARGDALKAEYIGKALAVEVLSKYCLLREESQAHDFASRLSPSQLAVIGSYIKQHLAGDIRLDDLAALVGMSRTPFVKRFKAATDFSPYQYVLQARVQSAQVMLQETNLPIADIASRCGFTDQAHFSSVFNRIAGIRPSAYRRSLPQGKAVPLRDVS